MPLPASLLPRASASRLAAAASAAALSRLPARAMRRRMAPTPALNDERIKQENEAMRERLRDAKSRVRALMNENQPVATGTSAPARPPAPAATRSNTTTRVPPTPTAGANPSVSARAVRRMSLTPVVANQHLPRANQQPIRPRNRLAPVNEDNNNICARTLANQNERGHPSTRASANANNADRNNASAGTRANVARVGNEPRQGPSAIAAPQRPSATRARAPARPTPMRATSGRDQAQAQVQAAAQPNASPSRRVRHRAPSRAAAATPTTTPVPARAYVPRPRRHVTPTLNDPKIKQANVELRQRILEAKPVAKASVGFPEPRPQLQPFQSDANGHTATLQVNIDTNIHFVTPDASPRSDRQSVHREEDEENQSHLEGDMEHNLITHPEAEIVPVDAHLTEVPATLASVTETSPLTLDDINIFDEAFGEGSFGKVHLANVRTTITSFRSILGHQEMVNANPREPTMMAIKVMKLMRKRDGHDENMNTNAREGRSDDTSTSTTGSIPAHGLQDPALAERDALLAIPPHPMVIRLHAAIQDQPTNKLYLLTELGWRGDLRHLQFRQPRRAFKEQDARVYAASIALGLQHIHASNYVHRDIKPDNIVIGEDKRPKIIDFGLAKRLEPGERTTDRCGTLSYSAPEILLAKEEEEADRRRRHQLDPSAYQTNHGYGNNYGLDNNIDTPNESRGFNKAIDWWAYGAMLYEMLVGRPPFRSQHPDPTYAKQLTEDSLKRYGQGLVELPFPGFVSSDARNLLEQLLARDPETRLGMNGDDELRSHPWFKDIDWSALLTGQFPQLECVF